MQYSMINYHKKHFELENNIYIESKIIKEKPKYPKYLK